MKKEHAEHNEKVCDLLIKDGGCHDWVVTTAFYSALHFVQHEIFPLDVKGKTYISFEKYYNEHFFGIKNKPSKHTATINLVYSSLGSSPGFLYKWLHDTCRTARYNNYKVHPSIAQLAKDRLSSLKSDLKK